jgi:hypothetical protein
MDAQIITWHKVEVEGYPECVVKSEGAEAKTITMAVDGELGVRAIEHEEPSAPYAIDRWTGSKEATVGGKAYSDVLAVVEFSGTCPSGAEAKMAFHGSIGAEVGSYNTTTKEFQQIASDQPEANPAENTPSPPLATWYFYNFLTRRWEPVEIGVWFDSFAAKVHGTVKDVYTGGISFTWKFGKK